MPDKDRQEDVIRGRPKWEVFGRTAALFLLFLAMTLIGWTGLKFADALNRPIRELLPILAGVAAMVIITFFGQWLYEVLRSKRRTTTK